MKRENPPVQIRGRRGGEAESHIEEAAEARKNPGVWFLFKAYPKPTEKEKASGYGMATTIRGGKVAAFRPKGAFDARGAMDDGTLKVFLMYLGKAVEDEINAKLTAEAAKK